MSSYEDKEFNYFDQVRSEVLAWMPEKVEKVFEIGCGSGATLSHIKQNGIASWVGGMELVGNVVQAGKGNIDLLLEGNIEVTDIPLNEASIDVILCLDVLEHLIDPWVAVSKLKQYLKPDGIIIASLPNVRNLKVIIPLIFKDDWKYVDAGQLDRTHLRFFTNKTAVELFHCAGLKVVATPAYFSDKGNAGLANKVTLGFFRKFLQGNIFVVAKNTTK
jgi:2-polyprenyl-3-methyl-5-hydroxy-6-metoxy-1,4-benzoquinol methylase